jgi:predicted metal-dependent hydrolase
LIIIINPYKNNKRWRDGGYMMEEIEIENLNKQINKWNTIIENLIKEEPKILSDENLITASFYDGMIQLAIALIIGYDLNDLNPKINLRNHLLNITPKLESDENFYVRIPIKTFYCEEKLSDEDKKEVADAYIKSINKIVKQISAWNAYDYSGLMPKEDYKKYMKKPNCD